MTTLHINAAPGDFADTVLMPGDPLRARHIAETFLEEIRQVTDVRNMLGFTGRYRGRRLSVMGSGMGIPSISIYAKELITEYGVKRLLRVGTCGAVRADVRLRDVIIGMGACTDSKTTRLRFGGHDFAAIADYDLLRKAVEAAKAHGIEVRIGNIFSSDLFYTLEPHMFDVMERFGILGVEMEAAGLYGVTAEYGGEALCILTVADHICSGEQSSVEERRSAGAPSTTCCVSCWTLRWRGSHVGWVSRAKVRNRSCAHRVERGVTRQIHLIVAKIGLDIT